ncbi:MAG: nucleotide sugar dehydrogenase [Phycisphaerales bacterium]
MGTQQRGQSGRGTRGHDSVGDGRGAAISASARDLIAGFETRSATIGVVGLGYVGLPLVRAMHDAGFRVIGFDIDESKITSLKAGETYLKHLGTGLAKELARSDRFVPTTDEKALRSCDAIAVCVPTPLGKHQEPDLSFVESSCRMVARMLKQGGLVSLESTTYPGTTREICKSILESREDGTKHVCGKDFFLCFSPEREDPGRASAETRTIPRLVGGVDEASTRVGVAFYSAAIERVIGVSSAEVAEAAKLLENIYRAVNIALVNELKPLMTRMGIDVWEVIRAASTKPYGFQAFYPGPGLGGHCIPIDPFYLTYKAKEFGVATRFIELAGEINSRMPGYVVERLAGALNDDGKALKGARILVCGLAYKPDVDDVRETPAAEIIRLLHEAHAEVSYHDPHVAKFPAMRRYKYRLSSVAMTVETLGKADAVVIVTNHSSVDYATIGRHARLIIDTRNAMAGVEGVTARVVKA